MSDDTDVRENVQRINNGEILHAVQWIQRRLKAEKRAINVFVLRVCKLLPWEVYPSRCAVHMHVNVRLLCLNVTQSAQVCMLM